MSRVHEIQAALAAGDPELRRRGVQGIPEVATLDQPRLLLAALGDEDWRVRKEAVAIALELGPSEALITTLVGAFAPGENVGLRNAVVEALAAFGSPAIDALSLALDSLDADGRKLAAEALGRAHDASALPALEKLASDADPNVRVAAIDHLAELGAVAREGATRVLLEALGDDDVHVRLATLAGLSRLKATVPWELLEALTGHPMLRASALALSARSGDHRAALALSLALDDERRSVFAVAVAGLTELVLAGELLLPALRERLSSIGARARERLVEAAWSCEDDEAHRAALVLAALAGEERAIDPTLDAFLGERASREAEAALRIFGPRALPRILDRIGEGRDEARASLVSLIVSIVPSEGDEAVSRALRKAIHDESPSVAGPALIALATLGGASDLATTASLVSSPNPRVAVAAEAALASLAARHPEAARSWVRDAISHEGSHLAAAVALGAMPPGPHDHLEDDIAFLGRVLGGSDPRARRAAAIALGELGSPLGLDLVLEALRDDSTHVRLAAVAALGELRTREGRPLASAKLAELAGEDDADIVVAALRALGNTGDPSVVPVLVPLVRSPSPAIAVAAVSALGRLDTSSGLPALLEASRGSEAEVVKAALLALEGDPRALDCFGAALDHEAWDVRTLAADGLTLFDPAAAEDLLQRRLVRETEPVVREAIDRALEVVGSRLVRRSMPPFPVDS